MTGNGILLRISSLCLLLVVSISTAQCPEGFDHVDGSDECFVLLKEKGMTTWSGAQRMCSEAGLRLAAPSNNIAVKLRKLLLDKYGRNGWNLAWVNAKGLNVEKKFVWQQSGGGSISCDDPLMVPGSCRFATGTTHCMVMLIHEWNLGREPEKPYGSAPSTWDYYYALCQLD